jgi:hypothetical protein
MCPITVISGALTPRVTTGVGIDTKTLIDGEDSWKLVAKTVGRAIATRTGLTGALT